MLVFPVFLTLLAVVPLILWAALLELTWMSVLTGKPHIWSEQAMLILCVFCYIFLFVAFLNFCFLWPFLSVIGAWLIHGYLCNLVQFWVCFMVAFLNLSHVCFSPVSRRLRTRSKHFITSERRYVYALSFGSTVVCDCGSYPPWEVLGRMQTKTWRLITTLIYISIPREVPFEQVNVYKHKADTISSYPCCPFVLFMAQQIHQDRTAKYILWLSTVRIFSSAYTAW